MRIATVRQSGIRRQVRASMALGLVALFAVGCALSGSTVQAGVIGSTAFTYSGPGLGTLSIPALYTFQPNNNNTSSPQNLVVPIKRFDDNDYIDIEFTVDTSDGVTEYYFFESVDNNTGIDWSGYEMTLGHGVGNNFDTSSLLPGLDFDAPDYDDPPASSIFSSVVMTPGKLTFSGGLHGSGAESYQFRIDVPDNLAGGTYTFTLRQAPIAVPEPASIALAGMGVVGLARLVRRRR